MTNREKANELIAKTKDEIIKTIGLPTEKNRIFDVPMEYLLDKVYVEQICPNPNCSKGDGFSVKCVKCAEDFWNTKMDGITRVGLVADCAKNHIASIKRAFPLEPFTEHDLMYSTLHPTRPNSCCIMFCSHNGNDCKSCYRHVDSEYIKIEESTDGPVYY